MTEKAEATPPTSVTVDLLVPIEAHGEKISKLTLEDPDLGALEGIHLTIGPQGARLHAGDLRLLIAAMANIPPTSAKKIKLRDLVAIGPELFSFLGLSPTIGEM